MKKSKELQESKKSQDSQSKKRSVFLINPKFQLLFMGFILVLVMIVLCVFYGAQWYFFWKFKQIGHNLNFPQDHIFFQFINQQQSTMKAIFFIITWVVFFILSTLGLIFSHRIAGPLYRMHQHFLKTAESGKSSKVHFRKGDFFVEVADAYNKTLDK